MASVISVRVSDEEKRAFNKFSKLYDKPVSRLLKESLIQRMEDEYDIKVVEDFEKDFAAGKESLTSWEDFIKEIH